VDECGTQGLRRLLLVAIVLAGLALPTAVANASQLIDRNPTDLTLQLSANGEALLTYRAAGRLRRVLAWGAANARPPSAAARQVALRLDYSGGRRTFHGGCGAYYGPPLAWAVIACKAPDGSYWAVQEWQRELPGYGIAPTAAQAVRELRLSHWTGALPALDVHTDWSYRRWDHLYGRLSYLGRPAFGFHSTQSGNPLDGYGRNIYIDTLDSRYGSGWRRENSALTHSGTGVFCYSVNPHGAHPAGDGTRYRITVIGPGVTPDVSWESAAPGSFDPAADTSANRAIAALHDSVCRPN
jgi:hypothetical protein